MRILEHPLIYQGLLTPKHAHAEFRIGSYPAFEPYRSWLVYQSEDRAYLRRILWHRDSDNPLPKPDTYGPEVRISGDLSQSIRSKLALISLPPFLPREGIGLDGVTFGIHVKNPYLSASLTWWCDPPDAWAPLAQWFHETVQTFQNQLPQETAS